MHPHESLLAELKIIIDHAPAAVPLEVRQQFESQYAGFLADQNAAATAISAAIVAFGKITWPYRKAYESIFDRYKKERQEKYFRDQLDQNLRAKYDNFVKIGHHIDDVRGGKEFEEIFSGDEKYKIEEAYFFARERVKKEVEDLIGGTEKLNYETELGTWKKKQSAIDAKLQALRQLAKTSEKWAAEILDKVELFEEGWSAIERDINETEVTKEIDNYQGLIAGKSS